MSGVQKDWELADAEATETLGSALAECIKPPLVIYLVGDLGAGKTTLVRGLLHRLGHHGAVKSPTFTLVEPYSLSALSVYHLDLYRIADPQELEYIGLRDMLSEEAVIVVEWPERGAGCLPDSDIEITLTYTQTGRHAVCCANSRRGEETLDALR